MALIDDEHGYEVAAQLPRPRIVQHNKRRYSIRLEGAFWRSLETLSERRGLRLGHFVADLAEGYQGHNLSSYLRVVCMVETERGLARSQLDPRRDSLLELVQACPCPGVVISRTRTIIAYNLPFSRWLGLGRKRLAGLDLTTAVRVRTGPPLEEAWSAMLAGRQAAIHAQVWNVAPGRVKSAEATIVPLTSQVTGVFHAVLWLADSGQDPVDRGG